MIQCIFENGGKTSLRHVCVTGIVVNNHDNILLQFRAPQLLNGNMYGLIGGFMERNEDTKACILRELHEEAGIEGKVEELFIIKDNPDRPKEDRQNIEFCYIVHATETDLKQSSEGKVAWFNLHNLPNDYAFAFDHKETIKLYNAYRKEKFQLPIIGFSV